jgi:preprotein translocase subunit SecD
VRRFLKTRLRRWHQVITAPQRHGGTITCKSQYCVFVWVLGRTDWQALPQRTRKPRGYKERTQLAEEELAASELLNNKSLDTKGGAQSEPNADGEDERLNRIERNREQVEQNIADRKRIKRADATLQGKDGCAREFYECKCMDKRSACVT